MTVLERLKDAVGAKGFSTEASEIAPHLEEWRGKYHGHSPLLLKPATAAEVSAILRICNDTGTALVTQGGNTGLVGGQIPLHGEVLLSTQRLNKLRAMDEGGMTLTAEAGVTLAQIQQAAAEPSPEAAVKLLGAMQTHTGGMLSAFELIPRIALELVTRHIAGTRDPLAAPSPWYVLMEATCGRHANLAASFEDGLAAAITD